MDYLITILILFFVQFSFINIKMKKEVFFLYAKKQSKRNKCIGKKLACCTSVDL